jgi:hypothetical protein
MLSYADKTDKIDDEVENSELESDSEMTKPFLIPSVNSVRKLSKKKP